MEQKNELSALQLPKLEDENVKHIYNKISKKFSQTRYKPWKSTKQFMESLKDGSEVTEVGIGNGKNNCNPNVTLRGIDISEEQVAICINRGIDARVGDACCLPYEDCSADALLSVATIHHLSTVKRRKKAIEEMIRICRPNGKIMIECWADTEPKFKKSISVIDYQKTKTIEDDEKELSYYTDHDRMVSFQNPNGEIHYRYYHFFTKDDFTDLLNVSCDGYVIEGKIYFEMNNWIMIGHKILENQ